MNDPSRVSVSGPFAAFREGFLRSLLKWGYTPESAANQLHLMAHLSRWLAGESLDAHALRENDLQRYFQLRRHAGYTHCVSVKAMLPMLTYLRAVGYESLLAKYIRPSLGKKPLVGIRPLDVQGVYQQMSDRGLSPRTIQGAHWVLNAAFRQALQWEMIMEVPTKGLKLPRIRRREMRVYSVGEARTFLKVALPTMYGTLFALAVTLECAPASTSASSGRTLTGSAERSV
jgi:hypothetical protein